MFGQPSYLGVATADWVAALKSSDSLERRLAAHALAEIGRTPLRAGENEVIAGGVDSPFVFSVFIA
jgi:hypothetical protein